MFKDREFEFTDIDFDKIRKLLYERTGISLGPAKVDMVYSRLSRRLRVLGFKSFSEYIDLVSEDNEVEVEAFTNALTTNLTSFFREGHHFPILANHLQQFVRKRTALVWSSGCSTGEEAYSIAITICELYGSDKPDVNILATDIDTEVLEIARRGVYPLERIQPVDQRYLKKYFLRGEGKNEGYVKVTKQIKDLVTFGRQNLLDDRWDVEGHFDAIFCRNVMIYFDKKTQYQLLKKYVNFLHPSGLLFAGHSESLHHAADLFKLRGKTVYEIAPVALKKIQLI